LLKKEYEPSFHFWRGLRSKMWYRLTLMVEQALKLHLVQEGEEVHQVNLP
jgi:hypothetical protein